MKMRKESGDFRRKKEKKEVVKMEHTNTVLKDQLEIPKSKLNRREKRKKSLPSGLNGKPVHYILIGSAQPDPLFHKGMSEYEKQVIAEARASGMADEEIRAWLEEL